MSYWIIFLRQVSQGAGSKPFTLFSPLDPVVSLEETYFLLCIHPLTTYFNTLKLNTKNMFSYLFPQSKQTVLSLHSLIQFPHDIHNMVLYSSQTLVPMP